MKVLYIIPHGVFADTPSGAGTHIREIVAGLRNLKVDVVTLEPDQHSKDGFNKGYVRAIKRKLRMPKSIKSLGRDIKTLLNSFSLAIKGMAVIRTHCPDIIYERAGYLSCAGWVLARRYRIPRVLEVNGIFFQELDQFGVHPFSIRLACAFEKANLGTADRVVAVSNELRRQLGGLGVPLDRVKVHQNGVRADRKNSDPGAIARLRGQLDLDRSTVCGFIGHILPWHGVDILIRAAAKLSETLDVKLLIVGPGRIIPELEELSSRLGISDKVIFTGVVPYELVPLYVSCMDICTIPMQNNRNSPVKLFEYGIAGKAIISTMTPAIIEVWTPEKHGIGIRNGNIQDLIAGIKRYLDNPELRQIHGKCFQQKVLSEYTWEHVAERTLKVLEDVLDNRMNPSIG